MKIQYKTTRKNIYDEKGVKPRRKTWKARKHIYRRDTERKVERMGA